MSTTLLALSLFFPCLNGGLEANPEIKEGVPLKKVEKQQRPHLPAPSKFEAFTGKITKTKVRLRLQPNYEGPVLREMNPDEYVVVLGETDDFYAIQPPDDFRGYVFRTYVLDHIVEADRVNVRLKPDKDATIIGQLKTGDRVEGIQAPDHNKWLEIKLPNKTRFYIAKEYIDRAGDAGFKDRLDKKREAALNLLATTDGMSQAEVQKPFEQISITGIKANYEHIINDYPEFPDTIAKAKASLASIQELYKTKKLHYLEEQSRLSTSTAEMNKKLSAELEAHKTKINDLQQQVEQRKQISNPVQLNSETYYGAKKPNQIPLNMSIWIPVEEKLLNDWAQQTGKQTAQEFYDNQKQQSFFLKGIVDPYTRSVKNKPGDYMLLNPSSRLPVAFLYSTQVNLQHYVGHEVTLLVSPRDNYNFAFPAYFVLSVE
ncbi:MAG: SH3 domain-containing protein [Parachlamydiaceae bacterium]